MSKVKVDIDLSGIPEWVVRKLREEGSSNDVNMAIQRGIEDFARRDPEMARQLLTPNNSLSYIGKNQYNPRGMDDDAARAFEDMARRFLAWSSATTYGEQGAGYYDEILDPVKKVTDQMFKLLESTKGSDMESQVQEVAERYLANGIPDVIGIDKLNEDLQELSKSLDGSDDSIKNLVTALKRASGEIVETKKQIDDSIDGTLGGGDRSIDSVRDALNEVVASSGPLRPFLQIGMQSAAANNILGSGAAAGLAAGAARVMPLATTAAAGYKAVDRYAQVRREYQSVGGSLSNMEVARTSVRNRLQALNLGISGREVEGISRGVMSTGALGDDAAAGVEFAVDTVKDGLLSSEEAISIFATATSQANVNLDEVNAELKALANMAGQTGQSFEQLKETYISTLDSLEEGGAGTESSGLAYEMTALAAQLSDDPTLVSALAPLLSLENQGTAGQFGSLARAQGYNIDPSVWTFDPGAGLRMIEEQGGDTQALMAQFMAERLAAVSGQEPSAAAVSFGAYTGTEIDRDQYLDMVESFSNGPDDVMRRVVESQAELLAGTRMDSVETWRMDEFRETHENVMSAYNSFGGAGYLNPFGTGSRFRNDVLGTILDQRQSQDISPIFAALLGSKEDLRSYTVTGQGGEQISLGDVLEGMSPEELVDYTNQIGIGNIPLTAPGATRALTAQDMLFGASAGPFDLSFDDNVAARAEYDLAAKAIAEAANTYTNVQVEIVAPPYMESWVRVAEQSSMNREGVRGAIDSQAKNRGQ